MEAAVTTMVVLFGLVCISYYFVQKRIKPEEQIMVKVKSVISPAKRQALEKQCANLVVERRLISTGIDGKERLMRLSKIKVAMDSAADELIELDKQAITEQRLGEQKA